MMILEIDAGNTALKWRLLDSGSSILESGRSSYDDEALLADVVELCPHLSLARLSSVAKPEVENLIAEAILVLWGVSVCVAKTQKSFAGLTVVYDDPGRLGVDRWLAMLAARNYSVGAVCVVDCGSAITVDWVDARGVHEGGYIVPGLAMQKKSLLASTGKIRFEQSVEKSIPDWGANTEEAVSFGVLQMAVSFIDAIVQRLQAADESVSFFLTGGDAAVLQPFLKYGDQFCVRPELVMDGLAVALPAPKTC